MIWKQIEFINKKSWSARISTKRYHFCDCTSKLMESEDKYLESGLLYYKSKYTVFNVWHHECSENDCGFGGINHTHEGTGPLCRTIGEVGSSRGPFAGATAKQFGNRKPLFGNGGRMFGDKETVQPVRSQFGEERPFPNRFVRDDVSMSKLDLQIKESV